jgi:hypothetical protein
VITTVREQTNTYTVNQESATFADVVLSMADDESDTQPDITINTTTATTVSATVDSSEAWSEVAAEVQDILRDTKDTETSGSGITTVYSPDSTVTANVQLTGSTVSASDLAALAGKDVTLNVTTADGDQWVIDQSIQKTSSFAKDEYDLNYTVIAQDKEVKGIDSDTVYQVKFDGTTDFSATVGVNVEVGNAYQYATLFEKQGSDVTALQTVVVDENGVAWFSVDHVEKNAKYYVGIAVEGVDTSEAIIPSSLASNYGADDGTTLVDADGTQYVVTGRSSSWGISGGRFAIYVAVVIGLVVLIVTLIMVTMNRIRKSKEKYTVPDEDDEDEPLDEDAIRLQVMQELLDEAQKKNKKK